jgi:hypothetical protein
MLVPSMLSACYALTIRSSHVAVASHLLRSERSQVLSQCISVKLRARVICQQVFSKCCRQPLITGDMNAAVKWGSWQHSHTAQCLAIIMCAVKILWLMRAEQLQRRYCEVHTKCTRLCTHCR